MYTFKDNSMISFDSLDEFNRFYSDFDFYSEWRITTAQNNVRGAIIRDKSYVNRIREMFAEKKLFRRNISIAEIVSILDSYSVMLRAFKELKQLCKQSEWNNIRLHSEYKIYFSKNRRIDFIIEYGARILLVEFRVSNIFPNVSTIWQKKESELLVYKELLRNYLPEPYRIHLYAFIAMSEYDKRQAIPKHIKYNKDNAKFFAEYVYEFIINRDSD